MRTHAMRMRAILGGSKNQVHTREHKRQKTIQHNNALLQQPDPLEDSALQRLVIQTVIISCTHCLFAYSFLFVFLCFVLFTGFLF